MYLHFTQQITGNSRRRVEAVVQVNQTNRVRVNKTYRPVRSALF